MVKNKQYKWQDKLTRKAKEKGYPARSVYKLKEIQDKHKILKPNDKVLDLGCSPGSWLLYVSEIIGSKGRVIGVDKNPLNIEKIPSNTTFYQEDIDNFLNKIQTKEFVFDVVLSDISPSTTGIKSVDAARSYDLGQKALQVTQKALIQGGFFVCKFLEGEDFDKFLVEVKQEFKKVKNLKPKSSRKKSREIFIIAKDKK